MAHRSALKSTMLLATVASLSAAPMAATAVVAPTAPSPAILAADPVDVSDGVTNAENSRVTPGAVWTEHYFPSSDDSGVELHADVLRPEGLPADEQTPVIMSVGPYFSHSGEVFPSEYTTGPSSRFYDLVEGADLMERGYTFVMVDLRGFGGSTGCRDWAGPGEQADTAAAVEWAASQPWSNGNVGLYGKSYDAVTGLLGAIEQPEGLEAVIAQEPLWDMYNYLYSNGVRRPNYAGTPAIYNYIASKPGLFNDTDKYKENALSSPEGCADANTAVGEYSDPEMPYWRDRDLAELITGSQVPLFVTQGMLEPNTKPEDMNQLLQNHAGEQRGWLGPWEHVRGNETDLLTGNLSMGREGWFEEVMSFYDDKLLGIEPEVDYPNWLIEDNFGAWRAQDEWPIITKSKTFRLEDGSYVDDGGEVAAATGTYDMEGAPEEIEKPRKRVGPPDQTTADEDTYYTWSRPLKYDTRVTGTPTIAFEAEGTGNVLVQLWDVAPDGTAVLFDEQMSLVDDGDVEFDLKDADWTLLADHQLVVGIGTNTTSRWDDAPSGEEITVEDPTLYLELQNTRSDVPAEGGRAPYLDTYLRNSTTTQVTDVRGSFTITVPQTVRN